MTASNQIAGSPADPRRAVPGRTDGHGGPSASSRSRDSAANSAAGASVPAASFGRRDPHAMRMFTEAEDAIFHQLQAGEISAEAAMRVLKTSDRQLKRHYQKLFGVRLEGKRPVYRWSEADRPVLSDYRDGKVTITDLCDRLHTSAPSVRKAMRSMGIALPGPKITAVSTAVEPLPKGVWIPLSHKPAGKPEWVPLDGAPMTVGEAHAMRDAGQAFTAQRRFDGGFDFEVFIKTKKARR